ncbi:ATP-binding cassette domain-containing protein [Streptomyces boncukensis]|uniref:ATP-binding cassette domain-containing protein n=1 Tax=Streptomyces boncukensis TaxID=2711219 RepID=A0A6G4X4V6_9ACTN|nr:ATP-binding cassette domain-containing protein [Streptomyces boncukensis]NGO72569.1 ATP-binding cassette domain-containing protein [Streptomyces boncukensis]
MIQAIGLTSMPRRQRPPAVDDLTFEARPGKVTVLLGRAGSGKSDALRVMLQLRPGRGIALFRGRPVHRVPYPAREIGVLLGDVPGHPARTARGHLRMLAAAVGVPAGRADDVLDVVGLSGIADQRLREFSLGMDRRLGIASALLGDPHTLVLDEPAHGLSPREASWLHGLLRGYADQGGLVLTTSRDPKEAARLGDRVVSIEGGRLAADQEVEEFRRTRQRPRVVVRTPHAERLAAVLAQESRSATSAERRDGPMEVVRDGGGRISVYGSSCAAVGEAAYRNGILVHQLAEELGDSGDVTPPHPLARADGRAPRESAAAPATVPALGAAGAVAANSGRGPEATSEHAAGGPPARTGTGDAVRAVAEEPPSPPGPGLPPEPSAPQSSAPQSPGPRRAAGAWRLPGASKLSRSSRPPLFAAPRPGPVAPLRYEVRRLFGVRTPWILAGVTMLVAFAVAVVLARAGGDTGGAGRGEGGSGIAQGLRLLTGWPSGGPFASAPFASLPPAALAAGLLGALAFGQEFRYPALAPAQTPVPRRLGLLLAKLMVSAVSAVGLCLATAAFNAAGLTLLYGSGDVFRLRSGDGPAGTMAALSPMAQAMGVLAVCVGCAWAGLLAAGVFRSTTAGVVAVAAVPLAVAPVLRRLLSGSAARSVEGLPGRLESAVLVPWPAAVDQWLTVALRLAAQPLGHAFGLSLIVLLCAYACTSLRSRPR